jgi:hypothetical protein
MQLKSLIVMAALVVGFLGYGFRMGGVDSPDLSTPQKSFAAFVDILKSGNVDALGKVATPTGQVSLVALYQIEDYKEGMTVLGTELGNSTPRWEEITEDIYFASARVGEKVHKMEFTKEEPGWMLYHWQIGGGADHVQEPAAGSED